MFSAGPSGFNHASFSKFLVLITLVTFFLSPFVGQHAKLGLSLPAILRHGELWRLVTHAFLVPSPGELIVSLLLLYSFRLFERQYGTPKYAAFAVVSMFLSTLASLSFTAWHGRSNMFTGPHGLIFAALTQFAFDIPHTFSCRVMGFSFTDKYISYLLGVQLAFSNFPDSLYAALAGVLAGLAYRADFLRVKRFAFPEAVKRFCTQYILPLLRSSPGRRSPGRRSLGGRSYEPAAHYPTEAHQGYVDQLLEPENAAPAWNHPVPQHATIAQGFHPPPTGPPPPPMPIEPPSEESILALVGMGFDRIDAMRALQITHGELNAATNMLLDHTSLS